MINIKHIALEHDCFPIRWWLKDDKGKVYTIRERGGTCVVHHGIKSIFSVTDADVISEFEVEEQSDVSTLPIALDKMNAILLPGATDATIDENFIEYTDNHAAQVQQTRDKKIKKLIKKK
jgi:hypothetical protein